MIKFKDFEFINESLDTPIVDYILTDDSKLPSSAYYQFKIEDTMYSIIFSLSNSKGLYKIHAGMLPSGKNMKLWKIKPNHIRKFLSTAILIIFDAMDDVLKNKIFGLAIRLPKEIKKNYVELTKKIINSKYKMIMKVLPVSKSEEDDNFNYIFVAKQGQNIQKLFNSKDFTAYNFSNYTEISTKALESLTDKRFIKKTNLSDQPLYKNFTINYENEELREIAHKIITNVSPMRKLKIESDTIDDTKDVKIVDHKEKIKYTDKTLITDHYDSETVLENFNCKSINFEEVFNIKNFGEINIILDKTQQKQLDILNVEFQNQIDLKKIDNIISNGKIWSYTCGTGAFNKPLRAFFRYYNKGFNALPDEPSAEFVKSNIMDSASSWYKLSKIYNILKPTTQDIVVFRGTPVPDIDYEWEENIITDPGFMSTSASYLRARSFKDSNGSLLVIRVPSGSKIIPINGHSDYSFEHELLLPPLSILKVFKVMKFGIEQIVFVDYIGNGMDSFIEKIKDVFPEIDNSLKKYDISTRETIKSQMASKFSFDENIFEDPHFKTKMEEFIEKTKSLKNTKTHSLYDLEP